MGWDPHLPLTPPPRAYLFVDTATSGMYREIKVVDWREGGVKTPARVFSLGTNSSTVDTTLASRPSDLEFNPRWKNLTGDL